MARLTIEDVEDRVQLMERMRCLGGNLRVAGALCAVETIGAAQPCRTVVVGQTAAGTEMIRFEQWSAGCQWSVLDWWAEQGR
jgi:hypothetical protein